MRRLPALAARLRGRAARARRRGRDRLLPRGDERASSRARTTSRSSRARSRPPHDAERIQRGPRARRRRWSRSAPARPPAGSRRCGTSPTSTSSSRSSTPRPSTSRRSRRRRRSPRTSRSTSSCTAARSTSASCSRSSPRSCTAASRGIPSTSVCTECKRRGIVCVMVAHGTPCLGPVTHAGCGALCPSYDRGCYGCFGPMETPNTGRSSRCCGGSGMDERGRRARLPHVQRRTPSRSGRRPDVR